MTGLSRRGLGLGALAACGTMARIGAAAAADYPSRPIRLVIPFVPGGAVDIVGRALARQLDQQTGQNVIVENRSGAGGNIAVTYVVHAPPDGYTALLGANGLAANPWLYDDLGFDPQKDLAPVGQIGYSPLILLCGKDFPARTVAELVAMAKASPGGVTFASAGAGSSGHLAAELFCQSAGITMRHVPYRGGAPALLDVIAGRVGVMMVDPVQAMSQIGSGDLRPIAVSSPARLSLLPDVPTIVEAGVKGADMVVWWALFVPSRTPAAVIERLNSDTVAALNDPALKARMTGMGIVVTPGSPAALASFLQAETERYRTLIQAAGIKAN